MSTDPSPLPSPISPHLRGIVSHLEERLGAAKTAQEKSEIFADLGRLHEEAMNRPEEALFYFRRSLDFDPTLEKSLDGVARILENQKRYHELEDTLKGAIDSSKDRLRKARLMFQLGSLYLDALQRESAAIDCFQKLLEFDPLNRGVYSLLNDYFQKTKEWVKAEKNLRAWLDVTQDQNLAVRIMTQLGKVLSHHLSQPEPALDFFREILNIAPDHLEAIRELEHLYGETRNRDALADILLQALNHPGFRHPQEKLRICLRLGHLYDVEFQDWVTAEMYYKQVLELDPTQVQAQEALIKILSAKANWQEVANIYLADARQGIDIETRARRLFQVAEIYEHKLLNPKTATLFYEKSYRLLRKVVSGETEHFQKVILEKLKSRWEHEGQSLKLKVYYRESLSLERDPLSRAFLLKNLIDLAATGKEGAGYANQLLTLCNDLTDEKRLSFAETALVYLEHFYLKAERWKELVLILQQQIRIMPAGVSRSRVYFKMGEITRTKMNLLEFAEKAYRKSVVHDRNFLPAVRALRELLLRKEVTSEVADLYEAEVSLTSGGKQRAQLFYEMARLREGSQSTIAIQNYEQALSLDPEHRETIRRLAVFYYQNEDWAKAKEMFARMQPEVIVEMAQEPIKLASFWARRGKIDLELGELEEATAHFSKALEVDPQFAPALEWLGEIYFRQGNFEEAKRYLQEFLLRAQKGEGPKRVMPNHLRDVYFKLGKASERLGEINQAIKYFELVLEISPFFRDALWALVNLKSTLERWEEVQQYYDQLLRSAETEDEVITLHLGKAEIWESKLRKFNEAISCYRFILDKDPFNRLVMERLAMLYIKTGHFREGIGILETLARSENDIERKIHTLFDLAKIQRDPGKDFRAAESCLREILNLQPLYVPAMKELISLLQESKDWPELVAVYERYIEMLKHDDPLMALPYYFKLAELFNWQMGEPEKAIEAYQHILKLDARNVGARESLISLYAQHEKYRPLAIEEYRNVLVDNPLHAGALRALAEVFWEEKEVDRAFCYLTLLEALGENESQGKKVLERLRAETAKVFETPLPEDFRESAILLPGEKNIFSEILSYLREPLEVLFDDEPFRRKCEDALGPFARNILQCIDQYSGVLGVTKPRLKVFKDREPQVLPFGGGEPWLAVSTGFMSGNFRDEHELAIVCAMDAYWKGRIPLFRLSSEQLKRLFFIICKFYSIDLVYGEYEEKDIRADLKVFRSVFPRRLKSAMQPAVLSMARIWQSFDFSAFQKSFQLGQLRMGLLVTGSWEGVVQKISREENLQDAVDTQAGRASGLTRLGLFNHSETLKSLVRFSLREDYFSLRRKIGRGISKFSLGGLSRFPGMS